MAIRFEAYTNEGVRRGVVGADARLGDLLEAADELRVLGGHLAPLDGSPPVPDPDPGVDVPVDDLLVVVAPPGTVVPIHPAWHDVVVTAGPYLVSGQMPTMPGFDPGRALATGTFVLLAHVRLALASDPDDASIDTRRSNRHVGRARRERPGAGFYYPGARSAVPASRSAKLPALPRNREPPGGLHEARVEILGVGALELSTHSVVGVAEADPERGRVGLAESWRDPAVMGHDRRDGAAGASRCSSGSGRWASPRQSARNATGTCSRNAAPMAMCSFARAPSGCRRDRPGICL